MYYILYCYNKVRGKVSLRKIIRKKKYIYSIYGRNSMNKWTRSVQTSVVQGLTVFVGQSKREQKQ